MGISGIGTPPDIMKAFFLLSLLLCLTISLAESRRWGGWHGKWNGGWGGGHGGWDHGGHGGWDDSWEDGWDDGNWDDWWKDRAMEDCKASMEAQCKQMCQSMGPNEKCSGHHSIHPAEAHHCINCYNHDPAGGSRWIYHQKPEGLELIICCIILFYCILYVI